jgi:hypothetical protein
VIHPFGTFCFVENGARDTQNPAPALPEHTETG